MTTTTNEPSTLVDRIEALDCAEVATRIGLSRNAATGRFFSPFNSSYASIVCEPAHGDSLSSWYDMEAMQEGGEYLHGGPIELVMHVRYPIGYTEAMLQVMQLFGLLDDEGGEPEPEESRLARIVARCATSVLDPVKRSLLLEWLGARGISANVALQAIEAGTLALNDYTNPRIAPGDAHYGGNAMAAVALSRHDGRALAVRLDYLDPEKNGGIAAVSHGEARGSALWCLDWKRLAKAHRVIVVASPLDALSVETVLQPGTACVALLNAWGVQSVDWRVLLNKQVTLAILPGKPVEQGPGKGYCPGMRTAWRIHEALVSLDVPCLCVDQDEWLDDDDEPLESVNAVLQELGPEKLAACLRRLEPWLIPGMPGKEQRAGKPRIYLPFHDMQTYWRYRVKDDFTSFVAKFEKKKDESGEETDELSPLQFDNVAGFRVAAISRVTIASPTSTMTGDADASPTTIFAISVQVPRYGTKLLRRVVNDEQLHNVEIWKKLGPVFSAPHFARMVNILERTADIGARDAVNFVGLAWRDGKPVVNEGPDCFFVDPAQQCPYSGLVFPSGPRDTAKRVIAAYQRTFSKNGVAQMLVWALGAHLKAFLGFWPHFVMQAEKGTGKDTVLKRLERSIGMTVFSRQSMQTEFRILTTLSYTSHPVGWGELSANKQDLINKAVANLQESYQYSHTRRGAELKDFLLCAPVLLAGEDVPVATLQGKLVRNELSKDMRGPLMPEDLPSFPVREWLEHLATLPKATVQALHQQCMDEMAAVCSAEASDPGAARMLSNYGAVRAAWKLLCEFADIDDSAGGFMGDLTAQMNAHIRETEGERQPWVWILDTLLSEIARGTYRHPYLFDRTEDEEEILCVRTSHVMDHISREPALREKWDSLPVKSDRVFKKDLLRANVVAVEDIERTINGRRTAHMVGLSLPALERYGLSATRPDPKHEEPGEWKG